MERPSRQPRGVLAYKPDDPRFRLRLIPPSPDLGAFVEHHWIVRWDLRDEGPRLQENLPHPCVHLVFERGASRIVGVMKRKFGYRLEGQGTVYGIKFRPGAFYPFIQSPVSRLTDRAMPIAPVFGASAEALEATVLALEDDAEVLALGEQLLRPRLPSGDAQLALIGQLVDRIVADPSLTTVEALSHRSGVGQRTLQRLFARYVGVGPKWVIRRYRLVEAADLLGREREGDWARVAQDLGYFDQAHFIKDFKALIGRSPAAYAAACRERV